MDQQLEPLPRDWLWMGTTCLARAGGIKVWAAAPASPRMGSCPGGPFSQALELLLGLERFLLPGRLRDGQIIAGAGLSSAFPPWPAHPASSVKDQSTKVGLF